MRGVWPTWAVAAALSLALGARAASAQESGSAVGPRTVAVVNLAGDQERGGAAAARLREALGAHAGLAALPAGALSRALEAPLGPAPIDVAEAAARRELAAAEEALSRFQLERAQAGIERARAALDAAPPDARATEALAEAAFLAALVHLRAGQPDRAAAELELAARLAPERPPLDPVRYPPQVIAADRAARARVAAAEAAAVTIRVEPAGAAIYVDGIRRGPAPLTLELGAGIHHVAAALPSHRAAAALLDTRQARDLSFELTPKSRAELAEDARRRAADVGLPATARRLADLAGVEAALVITDAGGEPAVAVYERSAERLSYRRPVDAEVARLFGLLVPAGEPAIATPRPEAAPWYARPWGIAAIGGSALAAAITAIAIGADDPQERSFTLGGFR